MTVHISKAYAVLAPGVAWICGDGTYAGTVWPAGYEAPTAEQVAAALLDIIREDRCDQVDALHAAKELHGFVYQGTRFELNEKSQSKIGDMALRAALALIPGMGVPWVALDFVAADNSVVTFEEATDFLPFAVAAANMAQTLFAYRTGLKQACRAAENSEDLAAIDITTGWPE
jgi:hypothetical protein